ncbi:DUF4349 domain-containing protein [Nocardioides sp. InS609-2]|uniref:DUF4349 domain-containing protein n=1 Tax=Nocardioides sp. InS609-2 TaxID=2760705 RepID=UPI0020BEA3C4|nr:DUF4349 domain-containing protein [Nocardioides sp. InS609-2]
MLTSPRAPALLAGIAIALTVGLSGCSSSGNDSGATSSESAEAPASGQQDLLDMPSDEGGGDSDSGSVNGQKAGTPARAALQERSIISVGTVSLSSKDVQGTRNEVQKIIDTRQGEITGEETQTSDDGEMTWSRLELRVPSEDFSETMTDLEKAGTLENASRTAEDVTTQVIDTDVRIRAQERSLRRIEVLLDSAGSLRDVVAVEAELTRRQADLDSLKQQQAYLSDQTSMSTITVHIDREGTTKPRKDDDPAGFVAGLEGGWSALATFGAGLATVTGALLPFAVVLALLGTPLFLVLRRYAARRTPRQTTAETS